MKDIFIQKEWKQNEAKYLHLKDSMQNYLYVAE